MTSAAAFDVVFGPAYKGITLAAATAIALAGLGHNVPFCYNRKEAKAHGKGKRIEGFVPEQQLWAVIDRALKAAGEEPPAAAPAPAQ